MHVLYFPDNEAHRIIRCNIIKSIFIHEAHLIIRPMKYTNKQNNQMSKTLFISFTITQHCLA